MKVELPNLSMMVFGFIGILSLIIGIWFANIDQSIKITLINVVISSVTLLCIIYIFSRLKKIEEKIEDK